MQFSVIVEGPISRAAPSEEALSELERYLKSLKRSPEFIEQLKSGTPQIVKEKLTYKQAEVISDRLMEFGLESVIDPPTKPEPISLSQTPPSSPSAALALENLKQNNSQPEANLALASTDPAKAMVSQKNKSEPKKNAPTTEARKESEPVKARAPSSPKSKIEKPTNLREDSKHIQTEKSINKKTQPEDRTSTQKPPQKNKKNVSQLKVSKNQAGENKKEDSERDQANAKLTERTNPEKATHSKVEPITKPTNKRENDKKYSVSAVLNKSTSDTETTKNIRNNNTNVVPISPENTTKISKPLLTQTTNSPKLSETVTKKTKNTSSRSPLNKSAEEIKSLFNLANAKSISFEAQRFSKLKTYGIAVLSILAPSIYMASLVVAGIITLSLLGFVFALIAKLSPMFAILLMILPSLLVFGALTVLSIPIWINKNRASRFEEIKIQDEPKLFMLVTAVCKIINAPPPEKIYLGLHASINGCMSADLKQFFSLSKTLPEKTSLYIGAPLLENFSIKDFCYFTARECGRFARPQTRRPHFISQRVLMWLDDINNRDFHLSAYLQKKADGLSNQKLADLMGLFINRIEDLESIESSFFGYCERQLLKICNSNYSTVTYKNAVVSDHDAAIANNHYADIKDAIQRSFDEVVSNIESRRFANNLSELSAYFLQQNNSKDEEEAPTKSDLIKSNRKIKALINDLRPISEKLTLNFYQQENIGVSPESLLSVSELFKRNKNDSKQEKIAADFLCGWSHGLQFWKLPKETTIKDINDASKTNKLNNCIEKIRYLSPDRSAALDYYYKLLKQLTELKAAKKIRSSGNSFQFQHCSDPSKDFDREIKIRETKIKEFADDINLQNCVMGERLGLGLLLSQGNKNLSSVLYASLTKLHTVCEKINLIANDREELSILITYKPKQLPQHYQLHIRELEERINNSCRLVQRRLSDCLFNFYDKISIDDAIADRMLPYSNHSGTQLCLDKATVTLSTLSTAFKHMSEIAANIAAKSESTFKIETIKKL